MRKVLVVLSTALLTHCAPVLAPHPASDTTPALPAAYGGTSPVESDAAAVSGSSTWRTFFADPVLAGLIDQALTGNQELNIRLQEISIAKSEVLARQGEYQPRVAGVVVAGAERVSEESSQGVSDEFHELGNPLQRYRVGFAASWEIDAWNRLRGAARTAATRYLASVEGRNFLVTEVVAEIASSYYELMALDAQLEVLRRNVDLQQRGLDGVRLQKEAARVTELAVQRFEAELARNQSRRYALEQARVLAENRINVLLGRYPQAVVPNAGGFDAAVAAAAVPEIPAALLDNRPDVRQAAFELQAAKLDVGVARAAFYPSLSIEAGAGFESFNAAHLLRTPGSMLFDLAGNLVAPLVNRKAITAQYNMADARQVQAVYAYERSVLQAFTDVANQLATIDRLGKAFDLQSRQVQTLTRSIEVSNVLFTAARADYMEVLLTRRDALDAEMELIETRSRQLQARVHLYQALGGGWR